MKQIIVGLMLGLTLSILLGTTAFAASMTFPSDTTISADTAIAPGETWTIEPGVTLTIDPGVTITNQGNIINNGTINCAGRITNSSGTIDNLSGGIIDIHSLGIISSGGAISNAGTINIGSPSTGLVTTFGTFSNLSGGIINIQNLGTFVTHHGGGIDGRTTDNFGTFNIESGGLLKTGEKYLGSRNILNNHAAGIINNFGTVESRGALVTGGVINNNSGGILQNFSSMTNSGTIHNNTGATIDNRSSLINNSVINNSGTITNSNSLRNAGSTINNLTGGIITNQSGGILDNFTGTLNNNAGATINNSGSLTVIEFGTIENLGAINNNSGGTIDTLGAINNNSGGIISNSGTIDNNGATRNLVPTGTINNSSTINNQMGGVINNNFNTTTNKGAIFNNNSAGTINNSGTMTNNCGAILNQNGTVTGNAIIICTPQADLTIDVSDSFFDPVIAGSTNRSLGVILTNNGPNVAFNVVATVILPPEFSYTGNTPAFVDDGTGTITCTLPNPLSTSAALTLLISVDSNASGQVSTSGSVTANEIDPVTGNNNDVEITTIIPKTTDTTTSVASLQNPSTYSQSVSFTATVSAVPPATGTPTGTVQFKIDGADFGAPVALSGGTATSAATSALTAGDHTVTVVYGGDANFNGSNSSPLTQTVNKANAPITLSNLSQTYDGTPKSATATTMPLGLTVAITYDGAATPPTNAGSYVVVATIQDTNYQGTASDTLVIAKANQTITFGALSDKTYGDADFTISDATASSGLAVSFTASGSCTVAGNTVHITGVGSCTITVHQAGDSNYNAAPDVSQTFTVNITYDKLSDLVEQFVTKPGIVNSLLAKLDNAQKAGAKGNTNAKAGMIGAFINEVEAKTGKAISAEHADILITLVKDL